MTKEQRKKIFLEKYGRDERFIKNIGLNAVTGNLNIKNSFKVYIPKFQLETFQIFAICMKIKGIRSLSDWVLSRIEEYIRELYDTEPELMELSKEILRDLNRYEYKRVMEKE